MKEFTLTKEEFVTRSMKGEVFISKSGGSRYYYDSTEDNPFRLSDGELAGAWNCINGKNLFTLEEPKPKVERRWKWRRDYDGYTSEKSHFMSDEYQKEAVMSSGWYKVEDLYIDVEIKE